MIREASSARKEERLGRHAGDYLRKAEVVIYYTVAILLAVTAAAAIASAGRNALERDRSLDDRNRDTAGA